MTHQYDLFRPSSSQTLKSIIHQRINSSGNGIKHSTFASYEHSLQTISQTPSRKELLNYSLSLEPQIVFPLSNVDSVKIMKTFNNPQIQSDKLFPASRTTTPNIRCASRDTFKNMHSRIELKSRQASEDVLHSLDFISSHFKQIGQDMVKKSLFIKKKESIRSRKQNASQEMVELQKSMAQVMDRSKEKIKRQELKSQSSLHRLFRSVTDGINDLRSLNEDPRKNKVTRDRTFNSRIVKATNPSFSLCDKSKSENASFFNLAKSLENSFVQQQESEETKSRIHQDEIFRKLTKYNNETMPFSLALTAKMRHNIVKGVKNRDSTFYASSNSSALTQKIREEFIPNEKAKFLDKLDREEKQRKMKEIKSKDAYSNAIFQMFAINKNSRKKLQLKLEEKLRPNSRFLHLE